MTPNSFSDHGSSLEESFFKKQLTEFLAFDNLIVDIGFESTAPMNQAISPEEELERFLTFLKKSSSFNFFGKVISFDTYRVKNFLFMKKEFSKIHPGCSYVFNDVSGVLDDELSLALESDKFYTIFNNTHIPSRGVVGKHMTFIQLGNATDACIKSFNHAADFFKSRGCIDRLILDPGFGFSKTYEQNWELINGFQSLLDQLPESLKQSPVLVGLSKKSFLRKALATESLEESEHLHLKCLGEMLKIKKNPLIFRVHDPKIVSLAHTFWLYHDK